jgi:DNA-directed RNA polymerase specialized sigma24 family protein
MIAYHVFACSHESYGHRATFHSINRTEGGLQSVRSFDTLATTESSAALRLVWNKSCGRRCVGIPLACDNLRVFAAEESGYTATSSGGVGLELMAGGHGAFPQTQWTLVELAGNESSSNGRPALSALLTTYLPALQAHLASRKRLPVHIANDVLQEFIARAVLEKDLLAKADRHRGSKFRSFLLTALDNFTITFFRDAGTQKRAPTGLASLDTHGITHPHASSVPTSFETAWARTLIEQTLQQMQKECVKHSRADVWEVFDARIRSPLFDGVEPLPYDELVARFELESPAKAANLLITGKRMFERILRQIVSAYAADDSEIDSEITDLISILSTSGAGSAHRPRID